MSNPTCYYLFKAIFPLSGKQPKEYHTSTKKFANANLIMARDEAFEYYNSFIHGMLLAQGLTEREVNEITDTSVRKILDTYVDPKTFSKFSFRPGKTEISYSIPDHFGNEISISLVIDDNEESTFKIHSVTKEHSAMPQPVNLFDLESEYNYYKQNHYDTKEYHTIVRYFDNDEYDEGFEETVLGTHSILKTPFDWSGYDKKGWWL